MNEFRKFLILSGILFLIIFLFSPVSKVRAACVVRDCNALRQALLKKGALSIVLANSIKVDDTLVSLDTKRIYGNGNSIYRKSSKSSRIINCIIRAQGKRLLLSDVVVKGGNSLRLVDVKRGTLTIDCDTSIKGNSNKHNRLYDLGGAIVVRKGAHMSMKSGSIKGCEASGKGAGVLIEKGGSFLMEGGIISNNIVRGAGKIKGFDGRGAGIYNEGLFVLNNGKICDNYAYGYLSDNRYYGGVGGGVFSTGKCFIRGGSIVENYASNKGGGIYLTSLNNIDKSGGTIINNDAREGKDIFPCKKDKANKKRKEYHKNHAAKKLEKENTKKENNLIVKSMTFYEDEYVVLKNRLKNYNIKRITGVAAKDNEKQLFDTSKIGEGVIVCEEKTGKNRLKIKYCIKENKKPSIKSVDRYFFVSDIEKYSKDRWEGELKAQISVSDDHDINLKRRLRFEWNGLLSCKKGEYKVFVSVRDQYGKRGAPKEKRYGKGKLTKISIKVNVIEQTKDVIGVRRQIRFTEENKNIPVQSIWGYIRKRGEVWITNLGEDSC